jgi:hypothetical protein
LCAKGYNSTPIASGQPTLTIERRSVPPSSASSSSSASASSNAAARKSQPDPISQALWDVSREEKGKMVFLHLSHLILFFVQNRDAIGQAIFDNREVIANNAVAAGKWGYENRETVVGKRKKGSDEKRKQHREKEKS